MELESVAERERVGQLILGEFVLVHHLRLNLELGIGGKQRVVDHVPVIAGNVRRGRDRIENAQVGLRNELEYLLPLSQRHWNAQDRSQGESAGHNGYRTKQCRTFAHREGLPKQKRTNTLARTKDEKGLCRTRGRESSMDWTGPSLTVRVAVRERLAQMLSRLQRIHQPVPVVRRFNDHTHQLFSVSCQQRQNRRSIIWHPPPHQHPVYFVACSGGRRVSRVQRAPIVPRGPSERQCKPRRVRRP